MEEKTEGNFSALEEVEEETSDLYGKTPAEITAARGRLIRKIKQEIKKIKSKEDATEEELKAVEELELRLNDLLLDHKAQLSDRYDKEFIKQKADFKSLITVLPKAVGLSAKMVGNCVEELKEAKTNKARIFKSLELLKSIGLFAATPVIYTVKFIANHWYLILLLLLLLKLPNFKFKPNDKPQQIEEPEPEYEPVPVEEPEPVMVGEPEAEPQGVLNPRPHPVPGVVPKPGQQPVPGVPRPETDTGTGGPVIAIEGQPATSPVVEPATPPVEITPELEGEALDYAHSVYNDFFNFLNQQRYHFIIAEQNPDMVIVHNAKEFLEYVKGINPSIHATEADALRLYESSITSNPSPSEMGVYWVNSGSPLDQYHFFETTKDFADYIINNQEPELTEFFQRYTTQNLDASSIPFSINGAVEGLAQTLGISSTAAFVLFLLYEGAQYGLAIPTGGLSLGLPF